MRWSCRIRTKPGCIGIETHAVLPFLQPDIDRGTIGAGLISFGSSLFAIAFNAERFLANPRSKLYNHLGEVAHESQGVAEFINVNLAAIVAQVVNPFARSLLDTLGRFQNDVGFNGCSYRDFRLARSLV